MPGDISQVNPVAIAADWLEPDPQLLAAYNDVLAAMGRPPVDAVPVAGVVRPPYPMCRIVKTPGGTLNDMRWRISPEVLVEWWGDTDGTPGPEALERLSVLTVLRLKALEDKDYAPWEPVVTHVDAADPYPLEDPSGQTRWLAPVTLTCHPALAPELMPPARVIQGA